MRALRELFAPTVLEKVSFFANFAVIFFRKRALQENLLFFASFQNTFFEWPFIKSGPRRKTQQNMLALEMEKLVLNYSKRIHGNAMR